MGLDSPGIYRYSLIRLSSLLSVRLQGLSVTQGLKAHHFLLSGLLRNRPKQANLFPMSIVLFNTTKYK